MNKIVKICIITGAVLYVIILGFFIYAKIGVITDYYHSTENWIVSEYTEAKEKAAQIKFILSGSTTVSTENPLDNTQEEVADEEMMYAALRSSSDQYLRQTYPDLTDEQIETMIDGFISSAKNGPFAWTIDTAQNAIVSYYDNAYQTIQQTYSEENPQ